ncbi:MAG: hypothetical protein HY913_23150 [Desulfomonile tiedjei]|nr:hypothetical protein [Desulfomonile tiedjei]
MNTQQRLLWTALLGLAIGGTMLHYRIHPPSEGGMHLVANIGTALDLVVVGILFLYRSTAVWGLLLNGFLAFLGIILMTDFSLSATLHGFVKIKPWDSPVGWLLETTFADIVILLADFLVGIALYNSIIGRARERS